MKRLGFVLGSVLLLAVFCSWWYLAFFRITRTYHLEALRAGTITYGIPDGKVRIIIPKSVVSRKDFVHFCDTLLNDDNPFKRVVASKYLARTIKKSDQQYTSVQKKLWELCCTKGHVMRRELIHSFWFVAEDEYTDRIVSRYDRESNRHVRSALLYCLGRIRGKKSMEFLNEVALNSSDPDDAYDAAENISFGSSAKEINVVANYLERENAKKGIVAGPPMPYRLQGMKKRRLYRIASLVIAVLFPVFVFLAYVRLRKKSTQRIRIKMIVIAESFVLLGYLVSIVHYVLTSVGGGDTGAFSDLYQSIANSVFVLYLLCLYIINIFACQKYFACIRMIARVPRWPQLIKGNFLLGIFLLNLALIVTYLNNMMHYAQ